MRKLADDKIRVFFFESCFDGTVGGSHLCMYNLIKNMDKRKFEFTTGFYENNRFAEKYNAIGIDVEILQRCLVRIGNVFSRKIRNWYSSEYKFKKYLSEYFREKQFHIIVINNSIWPTLSFAQVCKRENIPLIVYERGLASYDKKHITASSDISLSIPISNFIKKNLLKHQFRTPEIERIYDGIDPTNYKVSRSQSEIKKAFNHPSDSRVVGIIGNVRPWKGQDYFINAFKELSAQYQNLYGLIVGSWGKDENGFHKMLLENIQKSGLENRLIFLGYREDIPEILSILDVFVHASVKAEPFGMVLLEAMAAGTPIVATNVGGPVEILNNGECGILVPQKNSHAIARACTRYLDDPKFKKKSVDKAYTRLINNFHINGTIENTSALFEKVYNDRYLT